MEHVRFLVEVVDGGAIIAQKAVEVEPGDTPESLQKRVMQNAEWILLPQAAEIMPSMVCIIHFPPVWRKFFAYVKQKQYNFTLYDGMIIHRHTRRVNNKLNDSAK